MKLIVFLTLLLASQAFADTLRVAVIDSGLDINDYRLKAHICPTGHHDFTRTGLADTNGHGTEMVGIIENNAGFGDYCLVIYKYYVASDPGSVNLKHEIEALREAGLSRTKLVNLSSSGPEFNEQEYIAILDNPKTTFVVAAGNEGQNLDIPGNETYPASYYLPNERVIGNVNEQNERSKTSNYGSKISFYEIGENVLTTFIHDYGTVTGTSASTAVYTGKLIKEILSGNQ